VRIGERDIVLERGKIALAQIQGRGGADILSSNQQSAISRTPGHDLVWFWMPVCCARLAPSRWIWTMRVA